MSDLTVDTAGSEGVLFNRKPLQNTCPALEQALAIVPLKVVFAFALDKERARWPQTSALAVSPRGDSTTGFLVS